MVSRYFIFLCLLFLIVVLIAIYYSIQGIFSSLTQCSEAQNLALPSTSNSSLTIQTTKGSLPLSQYHIFASWNSACSGQFVSKQQIRNVLSTGCRFLDFPITNIKGEPMIYAPRFKDDTSKHSIPLRHAIATCMNSAFQHHITIDYNCSIDKKSSKKTNSKKYVLHNYNDPLFIQLRFEGLEKKNNKKNENYGHKKMNHKTTEQFLNKVAEIVGHLIRERQYKNAQSDAFSTDIKLEELRDKVVLLVDITNISGIAFNDSYLNDITNLVVGHYSGVMMYPFKTLLKSVPKNIPPTNQSSKESSTTDLDFYLPIDQYTMAIPDVHLNTQPTKKQLLELAVYHNVQFMPFLFYKQNSLLTDYIHFFQTKQSAFIPIQSMNKIILHENKKAVMG